MDLSTLSRIFKSGGDRLGDMRSLGVFRGLGNSELATIAGYFDDVDVEPDVTLTVAGSSSPALWVVTAGRVAVSVAGGATVRISRGGMVGLSSMVNRHRESETAVAVTPVRALVAGPRQFSVLMQNETVRRRLTSAARIDRRSA